MCQIKKEDIKTVLKALENIKMQVDKLACDIEELISDDRRESADKYNPDKYLECECLANDDFIKRMKGNDENE